MANKNDLRVLKSTKNIKEAFVNLIEQQPYEKITITELAEKAMINRKTFYFHYESKEALLNEIIKDALEVMLKDTRYSDLDLIFEETYSTESLADNMTFILKNIASRRRLFKLLFSNYEMLKQTRTAFKKNLIDQMINRQTAINKNIPKELFSIATTAVIIEMIRWWLEQDDYSEEKTALVFTELLTTGFSQIANAGKNEAK